MGRPVGHPQRKVLNAVKDTLDLVPHLPRAQDSSSLGMGTPWSCTRQETFP